VVAPKFIMFRANPGIRCIRAPTCRRLVSEISERTASYRQLAVRRSE